MDIIKMTAPDHQDEKTQPPVDGTADWPHLGFDFSTGALIVANLVPLAGVILLGWDTGVILVLYWAENLVVGAYTIAKILLARTRSAAEQASKLFTIPFFVIHFGGFCAVHGVFLLVFIRGLGGGGHFPDLFPKGDTWWGPLIFVGLLVNVMRTTWSLYSQEIFWPVVALLASHGVSFVQNYLLRGEYQARDVKAAMTAPYGRIVVMHVAIIAAGLPVMLLGSPMPLLVILVGLKIVVDAGLHIASHRPERGSTVAEAARLLRRVARR